MKEDLLGQRFGRLVVIGEAEKSSSGRVQWLCKCDCGNTKVVRAFSLKRGETTSCGCLHKEQLVNSAEDLTGKRFGRLLVLKQNHGNGDHRCYCRCDCGTEKWVGSRFLRDGITKSCGCLVSDASRERATKHGNSGHPLYAVYKQMKQRCYNPRCKDYKFYGELGTKISEEFSDFESFYTWAIENGYAPGLTIDRIDPYGDYSPSNCRWITIQEQQKNKKNSLWRRHQSE